MIDTYDAIEMARTSREQDRKVKRVINRFTSINQSERTPIRDDQLLKLVVADERTLRRRLDPHLGKSLKTEDAKAKQSNRPTRLRAVANLKKYR